MITILPFSLVKKPGRKYTTPKQNYSHTLLANPEKKIYTNGGSKKTGKLQRKSCSYRNKTVQNIIKI